MCSLSYFAVLNCAVASPQETAPAEIQSEKLFLGAGWHEIPGTKLEPNCPDDASIQANSGCGAVISAWGGAIADTESDRLIIWGGGHQDYYGNELYALDLNVSPIRMTRLTDPSHFNNTCTEAQTDGNPTSRHTYNGLAYVPVPKQMFVFSGSLANCGYAHRDTWSFDLSQMKWQRKDPTVGGPPAACAGCVAEYDEAGKRIVLVDLSELWSYDPSSNAYKSLAKLAGIDYHLSGVIDQKRHWFFLVGGRGQFWFIDLRPNSKAVVQNWSQKVSGCGDLMNAGYPGLTYDSALDRIVGWVGGNDAYIFDSESRACTKVTFPGGPGPASGNGTNGRFRYFPRLDLFVLVNNWRQNAYALRLPH